MHAEYFLRQPRRGRRRVESCGELAVLGRSPSVTHIERETLLEYARERNGERTSYIDVGRGEREEKKGTGAGAERRRNKRG